MLVVNEVVQLGQMARFVGVQLAGRDLLEAFVNAPYRAHLWDVMDDFYEVAVENEEWNRLANACVAWGETPEDTEWADGLPF